jgi:hypothetical protein
MLDKCKTKRKHFFSSSNVTPYFVCIIAAKKSLILISLKKPKQSSLSPLLYPISDKAKKRIGVVGKTKKQKRFFCSKSVLRIRKKSGKLLHISI